MRLLTTKHENSSTLDEVSVIKARTQKQQGNTILSEWRKRFFPVWIRKLKKKPRQTTTTPNHWSLAAERSFMDVKSMEEEEQRNSSELQLTPYASRWGQSPLKKSQVFSDPEKAGGAGGVILRRGRGGGHASTGRVGAMPCCGGGGGTTVRTLLQCVCVCDDVNSREMNGFSN